MAPTSFTEHAMGSAESRWRPVAVLTCWGVVELGRWLHLLGVHAGGHTRLPDGVWIITSPVIFLDLDQGFAVTASTGRLYQLGQRIDGAWPEEAMALVSDAMSRWRVAGAVPAEPMAWDVLPTEIARRGLDGAISPWPDLSAVH
jgi:hypothetical protein